MPAGIARQNRQMPTELLGEITEHAFFDKFYHLLVFIVFLCTKTHVKTKHFVGFSTYIDIN